MLSTFSRKKRSITIFSCSVFIVKQLFTFVAVVVVVFSRSFLSSVQTGPDLDHSEHISRLI